MDERREVASVRREYSLFGKSRNSVKEIERLVELEWEKFQTRYTNKVALVMVCFGIKCFSLIKTDETWHTHTHIKAKKHAKRTTEIICIHSFIHAHGVHFWKLVISYLNLVRSNKRERQKHAFDCFGEIEQRTFPAAEGPGWGGRLAKKRN